MKDYLINDLGLSVGIIAAVCTVLIYGTLILYIVYSRYYVGDSTKRKVIELFKYIDENFKDLVDCKIINNEDEIDIYIKKTADSKRDVITYHKHSHKVVVKTAEEIKRFQFKRNFRGGEKLYVERAMKSVYDARIKMTYN